MGSAYQVEGIPVLQNVLQCGVAQSTGSPTGTSLMTRVASARAGAAGSALALASLHCKGEMDPETNTRALQSSRSFHVFCISLGKLEHRVLAVSHQQRVVPPCHNPCLTLVYPSLIFFPHFSLHSVFVRRSYIVRNVCRIFLSWNVEIARRALLFMLDLWKY